MFSIITTNKNKTAIAPKYITINIKDKNSLSNKIKIQTAERKDAIINKTEYIGLFTKIIKNALTIKDKEKSTKVISLKNIKVYF